MVVKAILVLLLFMMLSRMNDIKDWNEHGFLYDRHLLLFFPSNEFLLNKNNVDANTKIISR